jgi:hypothetical protein
MSFFRIFLRNRNQGIVGRSDFDADDKQSGLRIAIRIADSCSDDCATYDLMQDGHLVSSGMKAAAASNAFVCLDDFEQRIVTDAQIALRESVWAIGTSKRLHATFA